MPIRWSTSKVSAAMDMAEEFVGQAVEPLEQVRIVAREARNIPHLPQYVDQHLTGLIMEIDRAIGGSQWEPVGRLRSRIKSIHDSLPKEAIETEQKMATAGSQQSLI